LEYLDPERAAAQQSASYQYNRVFPETSTSEQVYADAASSLVAKASNGYNGTIFAYGQTGSGKTYTMQAIMASAAKELFSIIAQDGSREFIIRMAALEVYNENVRDLLQEKSPSVKLVDDPIKGTVADGLSEIGVSSEQQLQQLLNEVAARRQVRLPPLLIACNLGIMPAALLDAAWPFLL
jgi:centromeric protein E